MAKAQWKSEQFQSHAGSIEAVEVPQGYIVFEIGFNPTLVRLRHWHRSFADSVSSWFQSHAGSIEALRKYI